MRPLQTVHIPGPFPLDSGAALPSLTLAYQTFGELAADGSNVVWVIHALTANADVEGWWPGLFGPGTLFSPEKWFVVCMNNIGSCYGSTGPEDTTFPVLTIRDMARAHVLLANHLKINLISILIGGSQGGQQCLEWAVLEPERIRRLVVLATNARHSAWGIAFNETQRMALEADPEWGLPGTGKARKGLAAARAIAMLSYRSYETYAQSQQEPSDAAFDHFRASSYQRYQGEKLVKRFHAYAYWYLSKAMDSHHLGRGRGSVTDALASIRARTLVIGISSDVLFPVHEQRLLAEHIPGAAFTEIDSIYGHDGFLVETLKISEWMGVWLESERPSRSTDE